MPGDDPITSFGSRPVDDYYDEFGDFDDYDDYVPTEEELRYERERNERKRVEREMEEDDVRRLYIFSCGSSDDAAVDSMYFRSTSKLNICRHMLANHASCERILDFRGLDEELVRDLTPGLLLDLINYANEKGTELYHAYSLTVVKDEDIVDVP